MEKSLYFAYGANINSTFINERCEAAEFICCARLENFKFCFPLWSESRWAGGVSGIVPHEDSQVEGAVYALSPSDLEKLDVIESVHVNKYFRDRVVATSFEAEQLSCWIYRPNSDSSSLYPPSRHYLETIIAGARERGFSATYIQELQAQLSNSV